MIFSLRKNFIFIHVPKIAGKSVEDLLLPFDDKIKPSFCRKWRRRIHVGERPIDSAYFRRHDPASTVRKILGPEIYGQFRSFAFVRNPYDHAWSHYRYMKQLKTSAGQRAREVGFSEFLRWRLDRLSVVIHNGTL
jgi:predicted HD phosphohydrolase